MSNTQLKLLPDKPVAPKFAYVSLSELPQILPGSYPDKAFIQSVEKFGVLQPIGLIESDQGYLVAFGRQRILATRKLGLISIPAQIYPAHWTPGEILTLVENQLCAYKPHHPKSVPLLELLKPNYTKPSS